MADSEAPPLIIALSGAAASAISNTATYPLDLISTRIQTRRGYSNALVAFKRICEETGFLSLFDGLGPDTLSTILCELFRTC